MSTPESRHLRWSTTAHIVWAVIGTLLLIAVSGYVIGRISSALAPFVLAFIVVFLLQGVVTWLERRGLSRNHAVLACFAGGFALLAITITVLVPVVGRQLVEFATAVPGYLADGEGFLRRMQAEYNQVVIPEWVRSVSASVAQSFSQVVVRLGNGIAQGIVGAGSGVATVIFDLFLGAVIAFWVLKDLPKIRDELVILAGEKYEADVENLVFTVVRVVGGYLRGQTIASVVTGTVAGVGLAILGVPFALVLGIITLVLNYVPYIGPLISGLIAGVVAALMVSPLIGVLAVAMVIAAQQITDLFVTPRVMSDQVDLHPTLVIFSLLVGGALFGFWGMIFAIPVAATGKGLFVYYWERRTQRTLTSEDGALFRASSGEEGACEPSEPSADSVHVSTDADERAEKGSE